MNLKYLQTFITVCELESFTAAAAALGLTQPGISKQIQKLEQTLGVTLLERDANSVRFTDAGRRIYLLGKQMLATWQEMDDIRHTRAGALSGRLRIGASTIPASHLLPSVLATLHERHPLIELSVTVRDSEEIVEMIHHGALDVGMVGMEPPHGDLWRAVCGYDQLVLIGPPAVAKDESKTDWSWEKVPLILRESGSGTRAAALHALREQGVGSTRLTLLGEVDDTNAIVALVKNGVGFAIVSELAVRDDIASHTVSPIKQLEVKRSFYLACKMDALERPLVKAFLAAASKRGKI